MPILLMAGSWITSGWAAFVLPLLRKIPWQVWAILGAIVLTLYYGHVREKRGYNKCQVQVVEATRIEEAHRLTAANDAITEANKRAQESAARASQLKDELDDVRIDAAKLKNAKETCLPKSITDRFNKPRSLRNVR